MLFWLCLEGITAMCFLGKHLQTQWHSVATTSCINICGRVWACDLEGDTLPPLKYVDKTTTNARSWQWHNTPRIMAAWCPIHSILAVGFTRCIGKRGWLPKSEFLVSVACGAGPWKIHSIFMEIGLRKNIRIAGKNQGGNTSVIFIGNWFFVIFTFFTCYYICRSILKQRKTMSIEGYSHAKIDLRPVFWQDMPFIHQIGHHHPVFGTLIFRHNSLAWESWRLWLFSFHKTWRELSTPTYVLPCQWWCGKSGSEFLGLKWSLAWQAQYWYQWASFGEDQLLWPWADCTPGTSELIGEDLGVIISLDSSQ